MLVILHGFRLHFIQFWCFPDVFNKSRNSRWRNKDGRREWGFWHTIKCARKFVAQNVQKPPPGKNVQKSHGQIFQEFVECQECVESQGQISQGQMGK